MKHQHDQNRCQVEFQVGDWVWLRLNHRVAAGIRSPGQTKLGPKYFGPYAVLEKIGAVAYRLQRRRVPRYIMCFMLFSSRSLKELRQLNRRCCHQLSGEERLPSLIVWSKHGQRVHLGNCWSDGKGAVWLRPLGNHLNSLKKTTLMSSSRMSCFAKGEQCCGLLLWSPIREKEQAGPQP
jgi:hypothetical protein